MNVDQHIKNKFDDQSFEFKEEYWNAASALIDAHKQKKKRRIIFWWSFTSIAVVFLAWLIYPSKMNQKIDLISTADQSNQIRSRNQPLTQINTSLRDDTNGDANNNSHEYVTENKVNQNTAIASKTNSNSTKDVLVEKQKSKNEDPFSTPTKPMNPAKNNTLDHKQENKISKEYTDPLSSPKNTIEVVETNLLAYQTKAISEKNEQISIGKIPLLGIQKTNFDASSIQNKEDKKPAFFIPYFSFGAYIGLNSSKKNIEFNTLVDKALQDKRLNEEKASFSTNYGLEFLYNISPAWSFSAGVEYTSYIENINYSGIQKEGIDVQDNSFYTIRDSSYWSDNLVLVNGVSTLYHGAQYNVVKDTSFVQDIDSTQYAYTDQSPLALNGKNKFTYIEVPLLVGYQFPFKQLEVQVQSGISMAFLQNKQARYLLDQNNAENQDLLSINRQVYSGLLSISLLYPVSRKVKVYIQPAYKKQLNNSIERADQFTQRFSSYHINVGLRFLMR
jgi:hypothetical protein